MAPELSTSGVLAEARWPTTPPRRPARWPPPVAGAPPVRTGGLPAGAVGYVLEAAGEDHSPRWRPGERFHDVVSEAVALQVATGHGDRLAVDLGERAVSFVQLEHWADQVAARLRACGVGPGGRVALLFERSAAGYVAMLAVSRLHAAWVPLDPSYPAERIAFICADAGVGAVLTQPHLADRFAELDVVVATVSDDEVADLPRSPAPAPPSDPAARTADPAGAPADAPADDELAYIIYTSGTTGRPKGVAIEHAAICSFLRVAARRYGFGPGDRVYQGMTIAFDFSVEEIWVPLVAGATLVPAPPGGALVGEELGEFLDRRVITALCCVPTLLGTLDRSLPRLRLLLVSGEACPRDLVRRWHHPDRRFLNVYGPTETTVTCTWTELDPAEPVTIGVPLPTYRAVLLDPETQRPLRHGEVGELAIAGIGLSPGYVGRPELTDRAFVPDPFDLPDNPSGRLYRTGDLARVDDHGRIEYLGRIDTQVKIRGYRIELGEIESALLDVAPLAQVAVVAHERSPGLTELAGFYTLAAGRTDVEPRQVLTDLRTRLPGYMVPTRLQRLDAMPMLPSDKVDRRALPEPTGPPHGAATDVVAPAGPVETVLATALAESLGLPVVSVEADLFDDLGADSLRVARFCTAVRRADDQLSLTTRDVYLQRSVRALAAVLGPGSAPDRPRPDAPAMVLAPPHVGGRAAHLACGAGQLLVLVGYLLLAARLATWAHDVLVDRSWWQAYLVSVGVAAVVLAVLTLLPIGLKWVLIGRFDTRPIQAWSWRYWRFWTVRFALRFTPALLIAGSPVYNLYLRALGVRVGRHALVLTRNLPVCTDLVEIGPGAVVREDARIDGYRAEGGRLLLGRVRVGARAVVGEGSLLDVDTVLGDDARLAHASSLAQGQRVPSGRRWHGSPAQDAGPASVDPPAPGAAPVGDLRRASYGLLQVLGSVLVVTQAPIATVAFAIAVDVEHPLRALGLTVALLTVMVLTSTVVPRLAARGLPAGQVHRLYGWHWWLYQLVVVSSNSPFLNTLFGDSSAIVGYLRAIGMRFRGVHQTGSNFGTTQRQHVPTLCSVGVSTVASDGLVLPNADFSTDGFRVREVRIGDQVYLGNFVVYPPAAAVGDNCLLATKVMVPTDGPVRTGVGLLGSPAFEIPRSVARDARFDHLREGEPLRRGLRAKNKHNLVTALLFLLTRFVAVYVTVLAIEASVGYGTVGLAAGLAVGVLAGLAQLVAVDAAARGFRALRPLTCSLYDRRFWRHERYWKLTDPSVLAPFDGTPFKPLLWRLLGVRVGRMLLDDGASIPERSMVVIGDHVTLGARSVLHGHSLEDGAFKSGPISLGSGVSVGPGALVHYDVAVGARATVAADAFVMKGEQPDPGSAWRGNPAVLTPTRDLTTPAGSCRPALVPTR